MMAGAPIERPTRFESPAVRHWVARQHCYGPGCSATPVEPHHFPTRGAGGDDLGIIPLCRRCHDAAQAYVAPFSRSWQETASLRALRDFVRTADDLEWAAFQAERERFMASRPFARIPH